MDLSAFADTNFDVKEWLNEAFKSPDAVANKEVFAGTLVMKLQMLIQEVNHSLEETSHQILHTLPRVVKDAESLAEEAMQLQEQMRMVKEDIVKVERNTAESMETLMKIDTVKSRMLATSKALQEADNWTTLSADIDELFEKAEITAIAEKLVAMQQCLEILVDVPDYQDRVQHLETLKNRLEAMLSPQLIATFNTQPIDATLVFVKIFRDIHRLNELEKYYHKCQKAQLLKQWVEIVQKDSDETLLDWLNNFYDLLLSSWHVQVKWCNQVFVDANSVNMLCNLLSDVLRSLDPSLHFCIQAALKQQKNSLDFLMDLKQISERFFRSLKSVIQSYGAGNEDLKSASILVDVVFLPYQYHVQKYPKYEETVLLSLLDGIVIESDDLLDSVSLLSESVGKIFMYFNQAIDRCSSFTNGCMFFGLIETFQVVFATYTKRYFNTVFEHFKRSYPVPDKLASLCEDWSMFQHVLNITQAAGELSRQLDKVGETLINQQIAAAKKGNYYSKTSDKADVSTRFDDILLVPEDREKLRKFLDNIQQGNDLTSLMALRNIAVRLSDSAVHTTFEVVFAQIQNFFSVIPEMKIWLQDESSAVLTDLPDFSISPLEYITQVGQYLMTIPQHIEPFTLEENRALKIVFQRSSIPYASGQTFQPSEELADYILNCIAQGMMDLYLKAILKINKLEVHACKQLATDIDYLFNVLDDLGLKSTTNMQSLLALLKVPKEEFKHASSGKPAHLVKAVHSMRKLSS